jgi:uncharacterized UBP type Zn finger protein
VLGFLSGFQGLLTCSLAATSPFSSKLQKVDEPAPAAQVSLNEEHVAMLMDMGFTANQAKKALGETVS